MLATPRDAKYVEVIEKQTGKPLARRSMMDIEVREEARHHRRDEKGRGRDRGRQGGKHRDRRPPDGKFHDHVASLEPGVAACVTTSAPSPAIADAPAPEARAHEDKPRPHHKPRPERVRHEKPVEPQGVDHSLLPAFLFRPVPVKKA
jgi:hypothetical protein